MIDAEIIYNSKKTTGTGKKLLQEEHQTKYGHKILALFGNKQNYTNIKNHLSEKLRIARNKPK